MAPSARTEPDRAVTCQTCGQALAPGSAVCRSCGAAHGPANRCPHCSAVADVERHAALGFRCLVCGGPRVALDLDGVELSERTNDALRSAGRAQTQVLMFGAAGWALLGMGALAVLVASLVVLATSPGALLTAAAYAASAVPTLTGAFSLSRASSARRQRREALSQARVSALADVQATTGVLKASRVSAALRIPEDAAELLLAEASVASYLDEAPAPRVRIQEAEAEASSEAPAPPQEAAEAPAHATSARDKTEI